MHTRFLKRLLTNKNLIRFSSPLTPAVVALPLKSIHTSKCKFEPKKATTMAKPYVYVTRKISKEALDALSATCDVTVWPGPDPVPRYELLNNIANRDALLCMLTDKIDAEVLEKANKLKVISTMSVGYDHLDLEEIKKRKIKVGYTPDVLTHATAEFTVALLLATSRRLFEANDVAKKGGWQSWSPFWMTGPGLEDATVGIVGFGRIGQEVARRLVPFRIKKLLYFSRSQKPQAEVELKAVRVTFDELLAGSDFIIACAALTPETQWMFNEDAFRKMKKTAVFVNTSRGGLVEQAALVKALQEGRIAGAGLDVMTPEPLPVNHPLFQLRNCVITPHIASAATQTRAAMSMLSVHNILGALSGDKMPSELRL